MLDIELCKIYISSAKLIAGGDDDDFVYSLDNLSGVEPGKRDVPTTKVGEYATEAAQKIVLAGFSEQTEEEHQRSRKKRKRVKVCFVNKIQPACCTTEYQMTMCIYNEHFASPTVTQLYILRSRSQRLPRSSLKLPESLLLRLQ